MRNIKPNENPDIPRTIKKDWPWVNPTYTVEVDRPAKEIKRIEIDPSKRMADINRDNNVVKMDEYLQPGK